MGKTPIDFTYVAEYEPCTVAKAAEQHSPEMVDALAQAVDQILEHRRLKGDKATNGPTAGWLQGKLAEHGIIADTQILRRHISGKCACARATA